MPIEVKFNSETRTSQAGREYNIIEMFITNRDGGWDERPNMTIMPFHARLLLEKLPEFCEAILQAEGNRGEPLTGGGKGGGGQIPSSDEKPEPEEPEPKDPDVPF